MPDPPTDPASSKDPASPPAWVGALVPVAWALLMLLLLRVATAISTRSTGQWPSHLQEVAAIGLFATGLTQALVVVPLAVWAVRTGRRAFAATLLVAAVVVLLLNLTCYLLVLQAF